MKTRSDCILSKLTEDQRADLYDWFQEHGCAKTIEMAAQPSAEGFGLQIHKTTLVRFAEAERVERQAQRLSEITAASTGENSSFILQPSSLQGLLRAARTEFAHAVYELSLAATEPEKFDRLERALHHIDMVSIRRDQLEIKKQELDLHRQRLVLDRENFECNAARLAIQHAAQLQAVDRRNDMDDPAKIQLAREICFGPVPGMASEGVALPEVRNTDHISRQRTSTLGNQLVAGLGSQRHVKTPSASEVASPEPSSVSSAVKDSKSEFQPSTSCPATAVIIPQPSETATLGHVKTHSASESSLTSRPSVENSEKLRTQDPALSTVQRDTLGHTTLSAVAKEHAPAQEAAKIPEPAPSEPQVDLTPRKMPISVWLDKAIDHEAVRKYILGKACAGQPRAWDQFIKTNQVVWIDNPHILRLVAA